MLADGTGQIVKISLVIQVIGSRSAALRCGLSKFLVYQESLFMFPQAGIHDIIHSELSLDGMQKEYLG